MALGDAGTDVITVTGALTASSTLAACGAATFSSIADFADAVTLGDASADSISINGDITAAANIAMAASLPLSGNVTLGSDSIDTVTINGVPTR